MPFDVIQEVRHGNLQVDFILLCFTLFHFAYTAFSTNLSFVATLHRARFLVPFFPQDYFKIKVSSYFFFRHNAIVHLMTTVCGICNFHMLWETKIFM